MNTIEKFARSVRLASLACATVFLGSHAGGASVEEKHTAFILKPLEASQDAQPQIVGGDKADKDEWPATFEFESGNAGKCTATAIGPRVIITAAHCIGNNTAGEIEGRDTGLVCQNHWSWKGTQQFDISLCLSSNDIVLEGNSPYERIDILAAPAVEKPIIVLGYGCTRYGGEPVDNLHVGLASIYQPIYIEENDFKTTGSTVCPGDSGGAGYESKGELSRKIIGIAASGSQTGVSIFAKLSNEDISYFIEYWANNQKIQSTHEKIEVKICGIDELYSCRG